jgi:hypothetical protein
MIEYTFEITKKKKKQLLGERFYLFVVEFINPFSYSLDLENE